MRFQTETQRISCGELTYDKLNTNAYVEQTNKVYLCTGINPVKWESYDTIARKPTVSFLPFLPNGAAASATRTYSIVTSCPRDTIAVQMIIPNAAASTVVSSAALAVTESLVNASIPTIGGVQYNAVAAAGTNLGFLPCTFAGGNANVTLPTGTSSLPSYPISDVIPIRAVTPVDSNPYAYIIARLYFNATTQPTRSGQTLASADLLSDRLSPLVYKNYVQGSVDGVSNPSAFTATTVNNNILPLGFIFHTISGGHTVVFCGDSITAGGIEGASDVEKADQVVGSWATRAYRKCNFPKYTGFCNIAMGGSLPAEFRTNLQNFVAIGAQPSLIVSPVYSPNGPPTTVNALNVQYVNAVQTIKLAAAQQSNLLFTSPLPNENASDVTREVFRSDMTTMLAGNLDFSPLVYDPAGVGNAKWVSKYRLDGTHGNALCYEDMATYAVPYLQANLY